MVRILKANCDEPQTQENQEVEFLQCNVSQLQLILIVDLKTIRIIYHIPD